MYKDPEEICFKKHKSDISLEYHQCMCSFDYAYVRGRSKSLKIKHCLEEARIYKMTNFYTYIIIAAILIVIGVSLIAAFCSLKWYLETKQNPCKCFPNICSCNKSKKKKRQLAIENRTTDVVDHFENGYARKDVVPSSPKSRKSGKCMQFCLSEPVQDCCQFLDCDIFWRKEATYGMPDLGNQKNIEEQQMFQRRPSRPAPPPPKTVVLPQMKYPEPMVDDECEPVPEAPPSPEPVRVLPARSLYVDPLSFLQKPFMRCPDKEHDEEKQEPLYSKLKNMVMSKVRKSPSISAVNHIGLPDVNVISLSPDGVNYNRQMKSGSLASLHNIADSNESMSSGSKRSLSLASLHMLDVNNFISERNAIDPRRISVVSTATTDDIPPSARKDEYIDLEEMSKRMAAKKRRAEQSNLYSPQNLNNRGYSYAANEAMYNEQQSEAQLNGGHNITLPKTYTPNFIPASAFPTPQPTFNQVTEPSKVSAPVQHYYPPIPATSGRPAVPARTMGAPVYAISPSNTLRKQKPMVPPRPSCMDGGMNSPKTITRSPRIVKPTGPPPPPPQYTSNVPMESSI